MMRSQVMDITQTNYEKKFQYPRKWPDKTKRKDEMSISMKNNILIS